MPNYTYDEPEEHQHTLLQPGEYNFVIAEVFDWKKTKNDDDMLPIKLHIKPEGTVSDNLVFSKKAKFRIDQLLKSIGKAPAPGTAVDFDDPRWLVGCKGVCKIKIDTFTKRDNSEGKSNKVDSYIYRTGEVQGRMVTTAKPATAAPAPAQEDDEIPF